MAGPKFDLEWEFGDRLRSMSAFCHGMLMTTSSSKRHLEIGRFDVHSMKVGRRKRLWDRVGYLRRCLRILGKARREGNPVEIIVAYDPLISGLTGVILSLRYKVRLVIEINGDYSSDANYMHIASGLRRRVRKTIAMKLARFVLRRADGIKLLFDGQLQRLSVQPAEKQVVACFPNYVNTDAFRSLGEDRVVLLVGFPLFVKGTDIAIAAFRKIERRYPDWQLKIMGFYPDRTQLDALIGDSQQIVIQKPVLHRNVNEHIGRCAFLLQPSRTEGMGRVLIEAMAAGKPAIATAVDGIPTVIDDGVNGLLVPAVDIGATAEALERLICDAKLRASLGDAGRRKIDAGFAGSDYFDRLRQMYDQVVDGP